MNRLTLDLIELRGEDRIAAFGQAVINPKTGCKSTGKQT
jgi:hypothetical protein